MRSLDRSSVRAERLVRLFLRGSCKDAGCEKKRRSGAQRVPLKICERARARHALCPCTTWPTAAGRSIAARIIIRYAVTSLRRRRRSRTRPLIRRWIFYAACGQVKARRATAAAAAPLSTQPWLRVCSTCICTCTYYNTYTYICIYINIIYNI